MLDANDLLISMKKAAVEAVEAEKPVNILFGKVTSASPLKINVEQKMTLTSAQLVLTNAVANHTVKMQFDFNSKTAKVTNTHTHSGSVDVTVDSTISPNDDNAKITNTASGTLNINSATLDLSHSHGISGTETFTVYNGLVVGDEVVLLRMQGGQKYIVLDRIVS